MTPFWAGFALGFVAGLSAVFGFAHGFNRKVAELRSELQQNRERQDGIQWQIDEIVRDRESIQQLCQVHSTLGNQP
jgi:hypothetical protein